MDNYLATELYLARTPESIDAIEQACTSATTRRDGDVVSVAVAPTHVIRASDLLFGTGVGIVSILEATPELLLNQARLSLASGAAEIALPRRAHVQPNIVAQLKSVLGSSTPLTVDVTGTDGTVDLEAARLALRLGADYVSFEPGSTGSAARQATSALLDLASSMDLGGVKLSSPWPGDDSYATLLRSNAWAMTGTNARICVPVVAETP